MIRKRPQTSTKLVDRINVFNALPKKIVKKKKALPKYNIRCFVIQPKSIFEKALDRGENDLILSAD